MKESQMTLETETISSGFVGTKAIAGKLNSDLLPYAIGYVPESMVADSNLFNLCLYSTSLTFDTQSGIYTYLSGKSENINEQSIGVPFSYGFSKNSTLGTYAEINTDGWNKPNYMNGENAVGLVTEFNTDVYKDSMANNTDFILRIAYYIDMKIGEIPYYSFSGTGTVTLNTVEEIVNFNFAKEFQIKDRSNVTITTETISSSDLLNSENGIIEVEKEVTYSRNRFNSKIVYAIVDIEVGSILASGIRRGIILCDNYRFSSLGDLGSLNYYNNFTGLTTGVKENYVRTINSPNIEKDAFTRNDTTIEKIDESYFIYAYDNSIRTIASLYNGLTINDLKISICTAYPVYKIEGNYYVAEFTDSYEITGRLIPYDEAQDWQKNITSETNRFDSNNIPTEPDDDDEKWSGDNVDYLDYDASTAGNFITMYAMGNARVGDFGDKLWASMFSLDFIQSIGVQFQNDFSLDPAHILDYVVSLRKFPFDFTSVQSGGVTPTDTIYFGKGVEGIKLGGNVFRINSYSGNVLYGSVTVDEKYGGDFRDLEPYCTITAFIPFCGKVDLIPSQVMGETVTLTMNADFTDGSVTAVLTCNRKIIATLSGNLAADVQITASNNFAALQKLRSTVQDVAGGVILAGLGTASTMQAAEAGGITVGEEVTTLTRQTVQGYGAISDGLLIANTPTNSLGASSGFASFGLREPFILIRRNNFEIPSNYGHVNGWATNIAANLGSLVGTGFTVCRNVDLSGLSCTAEEKAAIEAILTSGFYL